MITNSNSELFHKLFNCQSENNVENLIAEYPIVFKQENWSPIGNNDSNYGIIENQQSNPIASLVEKITNSIDAILMRKCLEAGIDPKSSNAPKTMDAAIERFFPDNKSWDLATFKRRQAEEIQIVADGPTKESAVIIYDNGEGQHPENFDATFLSLMKGNKNSIHFVQGKYNMGGTGALVFCGKRGYQLVGSKKYDNSGKFGFTLIRQHPLSEEEYSTTKNTWYEYFKINGEIPAFEIDKLNLKLHGRNFVTGTVIKLYSYQMKGIYGFAQELSQSLNEFLFKPVLPFLTVDKHERYPNNPVLESTTYGLQRRLEEETDYVEERFSEEYSDELFGVMKVTCYVFRAKQESKTVKETREDIRRRFFKNGMSVLFSMNGQVQGHYTSEFITRALKFNLLKDYLLINVDCTSMKYEFRKELFMASRDRLRERDESHALRDYLRKRLTKSKLSEIDKRRKDSIGFESEDTSELIKSFAKNLPKDGELFKLLQNTLKLEEKKKQSELKNPQKNKTPISKEVIPFKPERFPTFFRLYHKKDSKPIPVPIGGEKMLKFETDVEDNYFDRIEEPGDLQVSVLKVKRSENNGHNGNSRSTDKEPGDLFNIAKSSPSKGTIKITFNPNTELRQGDEIEVKASLKGPGDDYHEEIVWLKIAEPDKHKDVISKQEDDETDNIGLPELIRIKEDQWEALEANGIIMNHSTVLYPMGEGDKLEKIYINLDSNVYLNHRKKIKNEDQILTSLKKYIASVYFHALFLYMITKRKNYKLTSFREDKEDDVTIDEYIRDVFDSYYSDFLLNFGMEQLMDSLQD